MMKYPEKKNLKKNKEKKIADLSRALAKAENIKKELNTPNKSYF